MVTATNSLVEIQISQKAEQVIEINVRISATAKNSFD
jgi:hypothetical protein